MKNLGKRLLSFAMALVMVLSLVPFNILSAYAVEKSGATVTVESETYTKETAFPVYIGQQGYETLEAALAAAVEGQTITLLADAAPALTSQRKITAAAVIDLGGKTLTLTEDDLYFGTTTFKNGNIVVDPSVKPSTAVFWMFANQTLTFDAVKLTATGVTGTYLIGLDGNNADLNLINGSEIIVDNETALDLDIICVNASTGNDIVIDNSKVTVNNLDGRVFFRGNYTVSGNSDIDLSGITKAGFRIEAGQTLTIADTAAVDIAGSLRDGGIHLTDVTAVYNKADTATVNATVNAPVIVYAAKINGVGYTSLADALAAAKTMTGDVVVEIYDKVTLNTALSGSYDSITFVGKDTDAQIHLDVQGYTTATGKKVAFEGLILSKAEGGYVANAGFMNLAFGVYDVVEVAYTNCTFANGAYASSGKVTFTGCTFYRSHDRYGMWAYGDVDAIVDNCTFADFRGIKMYAEGGQKVTNLTVKNSDFSAVNNKPAIVLTHGESVVLENNTYSETGVFELDLDGAPNGTPVATDDVAGLTCKNDNGACGVLVDGKIYTTVAQAAAVVAEGDTIILLHDSAETVELPDGVALDLNGHTAAGITLAGPKGTVTPAYTGEVDGYVRIWGEGGGKAKESYVLKLFAGDKLIATTQLNNVGGIIDGDVYVTWNFFYPASTDEYWTTTWEAGQPNSVDQPTKVELYLDGVKVSENVAKMSGADDLNPVVWENLGGVQKIVTGLKGAGTEADPYLIGCVEELLWFQAKVDEQAADGSTQFAGKYFKLTADIDLAGINWNPIGSMSGDHGSFKGVFDGDGHTIKNLNCQQAGNGIGLFARTAGNAQIKNLTLENVTVKSTNNANYVGGVVGNAYASTKISNVHVKGQIDLSGCGYIGGIAGHGYVVMDNVSVVGEGTVYSTFWCAGGILGYAGEGATNITNAHVEGLTITSAAGGLGAIVGMAEDNNGTQPISGANLSAKNVQIKTYTGAYGDAYADYALGYLYGGNPTSKLTGELTVDNVSITTSNGVTPSIVDAVATVGNDAYFSLQAAIDAADGKTVKVLRDITLTEALTVTGTVTLDLNGKTITGKPVEAKAFSVIENRGVLTITGNGAVVCDHQLAGSTAYAVNTITNGGALIIDGATIENKSTAANQIGYAIDNNSTTGNATVEIKNGEVKASGSNYYDGIRLFCNSQVNENAVTVTGGTVSSIWLQNPSDGTVKDTKDVKGSVTISGGTVNALYLEPSAAFEAAVSGGYVGSVSYFATSEGRDLTGFISGGTFSAPVEEAYCADGYVPVDNGDGTYGVQKIVTGLQGAGTQADPYLINNLDELIFFRDSVNTYTSDRSNQYVGKYVKLMADIDLEGINWTPIGTNSVGDHAAFMGTFDGNGHTISNLYVNADSGYLGFFARTGSYNESEKAVIKNLNFENVDVSSKNNSGSYVGGVVANCGGNTYIENVNVTGNVYVTGYGYVGGIVGHGYPKMTGCTVEAEDGSYVHGHYWCAGGVVGYAGEGSAYTDIKVSGLDVWGAYGAAGAVIGLANDSEGQVCKLTNVHAENVNVSGADYYSGYVAGNGNTAVMINVTATNVTLGSGITATDAVATVGNDAYFSLQAAIDAADGKTVTLLCDITLTETLTVTGTVTLDLAGCTISQTKAQTAGYQMILNDGNLTIEDSVGGGKISYTDSGNGGEYISDTIYNRGTLVINGGTIENLSSATVATNGYPHAVDNYSGIRDTALTVNGGTIYCAEYSAIRMFCVSATNKADLIICGGTIKGAVDMQNGTKDAALGTLTISGGTFETTANANNIRFANWNGGATEYGITASITGGSFNGGITTQYVPAAANWNKKIISGGTFSAPVEEAYCADGYVPVDNGDGTYGVKIGLPQVEITDVKDTLDGEDPDLTFALNFAIANADQLSQEYLDELFATYGDYYVDYVLTISGLNGDTVTFNANGTGDGYLAGQYDAWSENWVTVPFEDVVVNDGESLYIMEYAAKLMNKQGLRFTLAEVAAIVQNFDCGVYFTPEFLAEHPDLEVSLQLKVFTEDAEGNKIENIDVATNEFENNYAAIVTGEGKQTQYFAAFAEAYTAAQAGDTIVLLQDVKLTGKLTVTKAITIDGNGCSIIADENAVWYTVSGKLNIKNYKTHLLGINASGITLKDVMLDCNNNAAGINVYCAQNVVFDNVQIINATKGMAALTVNGSTLTVKNSLTALGNSIALDISNGSGVTSPLGVTIENGTVLDLGDKTVKFASVANNDMTGAVDANGDLYFAAMDNAYYYTQTQIDSRTTGYSNGLILLNNVTLKKDYTIGSTLNLNGYDLTVVDGKAVNVSGKLTVTGEGNFNGNIKLTKNTATVTAAEGLDVISGVEDYKVVYEDGTYKLAEIDYVAEVGGVKYESLQAAIDAAQAGQTVKVLKDIALTDGVVVPADKNIVLDLNGMTVSMETADDAKYYLIYNKGNLTITDSGENGKLSYHYTGTNSGDAYNTVESAPGSVLTVQGGTIENLSTCLIAYAIDGLTNGSGGDVTVNIAGGKITSKKIAVRIFANSTTNTGTLNISDGEIYGRVIIQNANANANKAVLDITGGAFHTNGYKTDVLYVGGSNGNADGMTASVSGGTFNGEILSSIGQGFISGGSFSSAVAEECWAEGKHVADADGDGIYTVHDEIAGEIVVENNVAPDCENTGSYDNVVYCEVCGHEMSRDTVTVDALGHSFTNYIFNNNATTTADGTETAACDHGCGKTDTRVAVGTKLEANKVAYIIVDDENVYYESVQEAIDIALDGQTVYLNKDAREVKLDVYENITLDLNGYTLTVTRQATANGEIKGEGLLAAPKNKTILNGQVSALPVWNGSGYYFAAAPDMSRAMMYNGQFVFQPQLSSDIAALFAAGTADDAALHIVVTLTYELSGKTFTMEYEVTEDTTMDAYKKGKTMGLIIEEDFTNLTFTVKVESDTGAVFSAVTVS